MSARLSLNARCLAAPVATRESRSQCAHVEQQQQRRTTPTLAVACLRLTASSAPNTATNAASRAATARRGRLQHRQHRHQRDKWPQPDLHIQRREQAVQPHIRPVARRPSAARQAADVVSNEASAGCVRSAAGVMRGSQCSITSRRSR